MIQLSVRRDRVVDWNFPYHALVEKVGKNQTDLIETWLKDGDGVE